MDGTWGKLMAVLLAKVDATGKLDWNVSVDSSVVRVHQHAATAQREDSSTVPGHTGGRANYKVPAAATTNRDITAWIGRVAGCPRRCTPR